MAFAPKVVDLDGLRVVLVKDDRQSVTVQAMVGTGSREESDEVAGVAHFLEHFVFKGTRKFPGMFDIDEAVDMVGGARNAYTSNGDIGFWVKVDKEKVDLAVKIVGQLVTEPLLPGRHFEKERGTIIEELNLYEDMPDSKAFEEQWKLLFGKTNLGRPVIGTRESLANMKPSDLRHYLDKWFVKDNMLIGVVGNWDSESRLLDSIKIEFEGIIRGKDKSPKKYSYRHTPQKKARFGLVSRKAEQAQLSIGLTALPIGHPLRYAMYLVNIILGGGSISRLFREVREKRGWAYSIGSGTDSFVDAGAFLIGAGLPRDKIKEAVDLITQIMWGLPGMGKWGIKEKELAMAKECYRGRISLNFDRPERVLGYALSDLMFENKIYTPEEIKESADKVTMKEIREVCRMIFKPSHLNMVILGDYEKLPVEI
ncbi:insulinase family protein [Candidatus Collierbacteria bacterium]|nr:insulinase family protein [Candidatus Collierbacteria bacterium]